MNDIHDPKPIGAPLDVTSGETPDNVHDHDILHDMSAFAMSEMMNALSDLVCVCVDGTIRHINKPGLIILGARQLDELIGLPFQQLICDDFAATIENIISVMADEADATPMRLKSLDGHLVSLRLKVVSMPDLGENAFVVMGENVTRQAELTDAIHQSEARFRNLVNSALDLICVMDDGKITYINDAGIKMLKAPSKEDVKGRHLAEFLHDDYKDILSGDIRELVAEDMLIPVHFVDFHLNSIDAEIGLTILDSGRGRNFMIEARDITAHNRAVTALRQSVDTLEQRVQDRTRELEDEVIERRRAEDMLRHVATHDGLTNLPNRSLMMDRLDKAIARAKRNANKCAVLFIDLDGFKPINDTLGHDKGDLVLRQTAERLLACVRETDTAARFGGDEFVLVLSDIKNNDDATHVARKVLDVLSQKLDLDGPDAQVGGSIGIALYPDHGKTSEQILKQADNAMYEVKGSGKNNFHIAELPHDQLPEIEDVGSAV